MELQLERVYLLGGTNGVLRTEDKKLLCHTIELPWLGNQRNRSCIPEGRYRLVPRRSAKFNRHLLLQAVPGRSLILIHPANNAQRELRGCIAPITTLTGEGRGEASKEAFNKLMHVVEPVLLSGEALWLTIGRPAQFFNLINKSIMTQQQMDSLSLVQRATAPTPGFFKKLRNIGLLLTAISGAIIAAPVALPTILITTAGYLAVAGTVLGTVSQLTVKEPEE